MKKTSLAVIAILSALPFLSKAQAWSGSTPGNIYYNSGSVGIGTASSPVGKLELNDGNGTGVIAYFGANGTSNAKGIYFSRPTVNTNPVNIQGTMSGVGATNISLQAEGGNVGIGTTSPLNKLDVQGGNASIYNTGSASGLVIGSSATGKTYVGISTSVDASGYGILQSISASGSTYGNMIINPTAGNVGIGTISPGAKLQVGANFNTIPSNTSISMNGGTTLRILNADGNADYGSYIASNGTAQLTIGTRYGATDQAVLTANNGNVGIGTTSPDEKLTVYGKIHSQEVKVDLSVPGPDYVFEPTYKLPSLAEIKTFVDKNHHLPEIPSAAEMAKNGLDLGDMNTRLLKKVEELTLYLIQQKDETEIRNKAQQYQIDQLKKQIRTLIKRKP
ncbi:MAG: hypothetical protein V4592_16090 [Bacteroidota bacterium]